MKSLKRNIPQSYIPEVSPKGLHLNVRKICQTTVSKVKSESWVRGLSLDSGFAPSCLGVCCFAFCVSGRTRQNAKSKMMIFSWITDFSAELGRVNLRYLTCGPLLCFWSRIKRQCCLYKNLCSVFLNEARADSFIILCLAVCLPQTFQSPRLLSVYGKRCICTCVRVWLGDI